MATSPERGVPTVAGTDREERATSAVGVVRSEEQLKVASQVRVSERAVLRKYVVTETITQTFQVRREEVRLEVEPVTAVVSSGADLGRAPFDDGLVVEMVLHREVPAVTLDVVPVERVRLYVDTVSTQVQVSEDLRKEQVAVETRLV